MSKAAALDKIRIYQNRVEADFKEGRIVYPGITQAVYARNALDAGATEAEVAEAFGVSTKELQEFLKRQS